jgi:hypothetical protein
VEMEITGCEIGTVGRMVHHLPATILSPVTGPVGSMGASNFHLFGHVRKCLAGRQFAADATMK